MASFDVEVAGGGPAGAACAIRLVQLGFRVRLFDAGKKTRQHVAESLPSSIRVILRSLGLELPDDVVVSRPPEHRVYWGDMMGEARRSAPEGESSFLVWRGPFDDFLRRSALAAGVEWSEGRKSADRSADFLIDASGRAGLLGCAWRERERAFQTLALTGHFRTNERGAPPTLIETFDEGFVWSAPLLNGLRDVSVFVDAGKKVGDYEAFVRSAPHASALVTSARRQGRVLATDATPYRSRRYCGPEHLLVGDAASSLDPLSAHGVHKAMDGALVAAAVVRTMLERPSSCADAARFYDEREADIVRITAEKMGRLYGRETRFANHPFWRKRARLAARTPSIRASHPPLSGSMRLRPAEGVHVVDAPVLENDYVVRRGVLVAPGKERPVRYLGELCLPDLFKEVAARDDVEAALGGRRDRARRLRAVDWLYRSGYLIVEP